MKRVYWQSGRTSRVGLVVATVLALGGVGMVEATTAQEPLPAHEQRVAAAQGMQKALGALKAERLRRGLDIDKELDPAEIGLIGARQSSITSTEGSLTSKRLSLDPAFAAIVVDLFTKAGLESGEVVAIGASGSFPALNVAAIVAAEAMGLKPILIVSVAASKFGANQPGFTWLDMETVLRDGGHIKARTASATLGAHLDRGVNLTEAGKTSLEAAMTRNGVPFLAPRTVRGSIDARMALYRQQAGSAGIAAYVNIGGGVASRGPSVMKGVFRAGLNVTYPEAAVGMDSAMTRFASQGVPVVNLSGVPALARRYGIYRDNGQPSVIGEGRIYTLPHYRGWLAGLVLALLLAMLGGLRWWDAWRSTSGAGKKTP